MIVFVFVSAASGCSSASSPGVASHSGAAGIQKSPQSLGSWTTKASMPTARSSLAAGVINGIFYAVGGSDVDFQPSDALEAYDPATDTWTTKAPMPTPRDGLAAGVVNGILYVVGGEFGSPLPSATAILEAYNPITDAWTRKADMPRARENLAAGVINGELYVIGGDTSGNSRHRHYFRTLEAYDPATDTWTTKAPMPEARTRLAVAVIGGILYVVGGDNTNGIRKSVEAYDPATNTWTRKADMPTPRDVLAASVLGGKLYAVGGGTNNGDPSAAVEAYDPVTNTWAVKANMPTARGTLATRVVGTKLYAVGGFNGDTLNTVEAYSRL